MARLRQFRGFTLIELLVVIAIMGILAALIIVSLQGSQKKASDTDRKTKAKSLATALEQRYTDTATYSFDTTTVGPTGAGTGQASGINIQSGNGCVGLLTTDLISTASGKKYLESGSACVDKDPTMMHRYRSAQSVPGSGGKYFLIAWQLKSQTEKSLSGCTDRGNGVYKSQTNACGSNMSQTDPTYFIPDTPPPVGIGTRIKIDNLAPEAPTNYFVVYGPQ